MGVIEGSAGPKADSSVLVQAAIKECHRLASLNSKHIFLGVLEACRPMISVLAWSGSGEGPLPIYRWPLSCCVPVWSRERASSLPLYIRALIPSWGSHPHALITPPKVIPTNTITCGVRVSAYGFGRTKHAVLIITLAEPHFSSSRSEVENWQPEGQTSLPDYVSFVPGIERYIDLVTDI